MAHVLPGGVIPLALLAGSMVVAASRPAGDDRGGRVELELAGVLPMPEGTASILVLREKGADTILPLLVPGGDVSLGGRRGGDLVGQAIEALGGRVSEVEIDRAEETLAGSRVRLAQGKRHLELRARPSESVALAVSAGVPIFAQRSLLDEAGLTPDDLARAHARSRGVEERL